MDTSSLMEQILSNENLNAAYLQVVRSKGAAGVDGMEYTELQKHLSENGEQKAEQRNEKKLWLFKIPSVKTICGQTIWPIDCD